LRKYVLGIGLVLYAVYNPNQPFKDYILLPWVGLCFIIAAIISVPFKSWAKVGLGPRWVWMPLAVLCMTIALSGVAQYARNEVTFIHGLAPLVTACVWFGVYLLVRLEGENIGKPIAIAVIIESVSLIVYAFMTNGVKNGGMVSPTNYDISAGFLVFGVFMSPRKWQWWLSSIAIVGLFFSGAEEGIVALASIALVLVILKDYSVKAVLPACTLIVAILVSIPSGVAHNLYFGNPARQDTTNNTPTYTMTKIEAAEMAIRDIGKPEFYQDIKVATGNRWGIHWRVSPIRLFGYGYNLTNYYWGIPHNIALIIIEQVGPVGVVAWLAVTFYCFKTSKRYYLWSAVLALGMFDHYSWTTIAPWYFAQVGLSTLAIQSGNIFKGKIV
jgi:hypothetical protein